MERAASGARIRAIVDVVLRQVRYAHWCFYLGARDGSAFAFRSTAQFCVEISGAVDARQFVRSRVVVSRGADSYVCALGDLLRNFLRRLRITRTRTQRSDGKTQLPVC